MKTDTFKNLRLHKAILFFLVCCNAVITIGQHTQKDNNLKREKPIMTREFFLTDKARRDSIEKPRLIIDKLGIIGATKIGEVGAGEGYFTFHLSNVLGDNCVIYANDISDSNLATLRKFANEYKNEFGILDNIIPFLGKIVDPCFPSNELEWIVVYHSFHEFENKEEWLRNSRKYLKKGGKLALIDSYHPNSGLNATFVKELCIKAGYRFHSHIKPSWDIQVFIND